MDPRIRLVVTEHDRGWNELRKALRLVGAAGSTVQAGLLGDKGGESHDGSTNAQLAVIHEFGAPSKNIPERSFLRSTFEEHREGYYEKLKAAILKLIEQRRPDGIARALGVIGLKMQSDIQAKIRSGIAPANAPATIAAKGSSKTLIDTGQFKSAINFRVVQKLGLGRAGIEETT